MTRCSRYKMLTATLNKHIPDKNRTLKRASCFASQSKSSDWTGLKIREAAGGTQGRHYFPVMAELVDAPDLGSGVREDVGVRVPLAGLLRP